MNNVKIKSDGGKTKVFVNDIKIPDITGLRFEHNAGEIPMFEFEMPALPDFEINDAGIRFSITSYSVVSALNVICAAVKSGTLDDEQLTCLIGKLLTEVIWKNPKNCVLVSNKEVMTGQVVSETTIELYGKNTRRDSSGKLLIDEKKQLRRFVFETLD